MASSELTAATLQHVTKRKLEKLADHIENFNSKKHTILSSTAKEPTVAKQVEALLEGAKKHGFSLAGTGSSVKNIKCYLAQAKHDPSVSQKQIQEWKEMIEQELEVQGRRYRYASLFGKLCNEWSERPNDANHGSASATEDQMDVDDESSTASFVNLGRKEKVEQREMWEKYAFVECPRDQHAIDSYLKELFEFKAKSNKIKSTPLHELQLTMGKFDEMEPKRFTPDIVAQAIDGLLKADFFAGNKRKELVEMKARREILGEIADVLNMDLDSIEDWQWEKPIPLHQRRQLNGKYRVYHDEEIHQAIFLQLIGMKWAVFMKEAFTKFFHSGAWKQAPYRALDKEARQRLEYYFGTSANLHLPVSVRSHRRTAYQNEFFMLQLPNDMDVAAEDYSGEDDEGSHKVRSSRFNAAKDSNSTKTPVQKKDLLHRIVTTEMLVQTAVYGESTILQSDFKWFGPSIPHDTIFAVCKFLGIKAKYLEFFRKVLEAKVIWSDDSSPEVKQRKRGIPMSHVLSDAFGEAILFCLDYAVNKKTGGADLYRFHDDLWVWGQEETCIKAWKTIQDFSAMMGLDLNMEKTGCVQIFSNPAKIWSLPASLPKGDVTWGLLKLDPQTSSWVVDDHKIAEHVVELDRQLKACTSVFAWVQAWNSYASRFLSRNLGQPANCFGTEHVNTSLKELTRVQEALFGKNGSAQEHLRQMLADPERKLSFSPEEVKEIPDAFFYFPLQIGGLEMQNPFIPLLAMLSKVPKEVDKGIRQAFESDEEDYEAAKLRFEKGDYTPYHKTYKPKPDEAFPSLEEFVRFREETSSHLAKAYEKLLLVPKMEEMEVSTLISDAVMEGYTNDWYTLDAYWIWVFELYGRQVVKDFGGVELGEKGMLPLSMVESMKNERVRWLG